MDTKSPDAFRTISEVAEDLDIPQHVLRFWETRFNQIKPLKRGGGRRYYRPDDVALLKGIRRLLYGEGYTIKGLQRILKEQGPRHVQAIGRGAPIGAAPAAGPRDAAIGPGAPPEAGAERQAHGRPPVPEGLDDVSVLTAVLKELGECRRILEQALQPASDAV
ncbi:MerR family transcriptional regulator [Bosea sp. (in: a-proteobacteria)]|uniref:MerR family transcriptional regulator n=1 Tax=Bosea sp. (in: a-proteobacteria) TaxID=1871050 RepID=UPI00260B46AD|nr:MerR family transcriptional regulator [Bosea sp. (in: a-proteobacteria)]MCO5092857.1 MerR family transcriptional regulator [Bosea sp. (in: a-proteobacteria)]